MAHDDASPINDIRTCPLAEINAFDPAILNDPFPYFARLREEAPVFRDPKTGIVSISTYDLIMEVNRQPGVFSNDFGSQLQSGSGAAPDPEEVAIASKGWAVPPTMLTADPPAHTRYRKLAGKAFTYKRAEEKADYIAKVTNDLIDTFIDDGACEFKSAFANHLPMTVIADSLGAPRSDMDRFHRWSDAFIVQLGGVSDRETRLEASRRIVEFQHYFVDRIEEKRRNPTADVISDLVHADLADEGDPRKMEHPELLSILQQLLVAGNETTTKMLTEMMRLLAENPEQWAMVKADPSRIPSIVEESLRLSTPTQGMFRIATRDVELAGVHIPKGSRVVVVFMSANRDEAVFAEPDEFNPDRPNLLDHLAFGKGTHYCLGANLSRLEGRVALEEIAKRVASFSLRDTNDYSYHPSFMLRGLVKLDFDVVPA